MPSGKRTQQFWERCWAFPHSSSGILGRRGKTSSPFATLEVNPHPPAPLNLYFCSALGGSCWLEAPTCSVSLKPGMPGSAERLQEKLLRSFLPQLRRSFRQGNLPVPSWHQSQQFHQPSRAQNPSHPNFHTFPYSPSAEELFPVPSWGQHPMGTLLQVTPGSRGRSCVVVGEIGSTRSGTRHPGRGSSRPPAAPPPQTPSMQPLSLPPPPEGLCLPVELGDSGARRWLRRSPGTERGLRDPHSLNTGFVLSLQQETLFPSRSRRTLPVPFPVLKCRRTSHGCYSLNHRLLLAANRSPPPSGGLCRGDEDRSQPWPCPRCPLRSPSLVQVGPSAPSSPCGAPQSTLPYPARRFLGVFAPTDTPRFSKCYEHPDFSLTLPSPGRARGTFLPLSVPQFPRGAENTTAASRGKGQNTGHGGTLVTVPRGGHPRVGELPTADRSGHLSSSGSQEEERGLPSRPSPR